MELYPFQTAAIEGVNSAIEDKAAQRVVLVLPTGAGKTLTAAEMIAQATRGKKRGLFIVHRDFLVEQASATIAEYGTRVSTVTAGRHMDLTAPMQVCMVQTLARRLDDSMAMRLNPDYIFWDECHHMSAASYGKIAGAFGKVARLAGKTLIEIGLTATPWRLDGKPLSHYQHMVVGPPISELIAGKYLCPFVYHFPKSRLSELKARLHVRMGDFSQSEQVEMVKQNSRVIAGDTVSLYQRICPDERCVFFGVGKVHSLETARAFRAAGVQAEHIDSDTDKAERRAIYGRFTAGVTKVLCNVNIFSEGADVPDASAVILARHTQSVSMFLQQCGRALRHRPGKVAQIIDQACNCYSLGYPDSGREWSLAGRKTAGRPCMSQRDVARTRSCPRCRANLAGHVSFCPHCGSGLRQSIDVTGVDAEFAARLSSEKVRREKRAAAAPAPELVLMHPRPVDWRKVSEAGTNVRRLYRLFDAAGLKNPHGEAKKWARLNARRVRLASDG